MLSPTHPTLSDGTKVADLVDVATRQVQMRALSDPELYELEMEQIFGKIWVFLGHESEIPNSGDFITRDMGSDSVLITRDKSGEVHVMLNVCAHRGMRISTLDAGNTQIHTCIYHGWAFRPNGAFFGLNIPFACRQLGQAGHAVFAHDLRAHILGPDSQSIAQSGGIGMAVPGGMGTSDHAVGGQEGIDAHNIAHCWPVRLISQQKVP